MSHDVSSDTIHHLLPLYWKAAQVATFQRHLMPYLSTIQNKDAITLMTRHCTTPRFDSRWVVVPKTMTLCLFVYFLLICLI
jgi:hypothetical protein